MSATFVERLYHKRLYLEMCLSPFYYVVNILDLLHSFQRSGKHFSQIVELLSLLAHECRKVGLVDRYKNFLEEAKEYHQNATGRDKISEALFLNYYARFLSEEGKLDEAKEQFSNALKVFDESLSTDYVQKASPLLCVAQNDNSRNQRDEAEWKLNEALNLLRENLGNHPMTVLLCSKLADIYLFFGEKRLGSEGDREKSVKFYKEAHEMMKNLGLASHRECILTLTSLGVCYQLQGNWEEAMQLYQESLDIAESELEDDHRWKIYVKTQMAFWWKEKGNVEEAKLLKDEAMQMSDRLALPDHQPPNKFLLQEI